MLCIVDTFTILAFDAPTDSFDFIDNFDVNLDFYKAETSFFFSYGLGISEFLDDYFLGISTFDKCSFCVSAQ